MARGEVTGRKPEVSQQLFSVGETARTLGRSVNTVYRMIHDDIIEALPLMGVMMIKAEAIQEILAGKNERARGDDVQSARRAKSVVTGKMSAALKKEMKAEREEADKTAVGAE
jgi:hypothetical protein